MIKATGFSINVDCRDPLKLCEFYKRLAGWTQAHDEYGLFTDTGTVVYFMGCDFDYIPPVWPEEPGKQQKQMHFDFEVDDLPAAVEHAISLGATKAEVQYGDYYVTMLDPEGHPFCLVDPKLHPFFLNNN
ncbi:MAG: VOC family protein [Oscillospiraceae bacterium]|jgi:predicted enzyme related to lactoylglutathione lyase|nr:VOC family protein [Oscillospiraceae bacterium]